MSKRRAKKSGHSEVNVRKELISNQLNILTYWAKTSTKNDYTYTIERLKNKNAHTQMYWKLALLSSLYYN
jgi:hypothetical protein